jgi:integrase
VKKLTDLAVQKLKPAPTRREVHDGNGLYLVIQPSGARSFAFRYRWQGKPQKLTFGPANLLSIVAARKLAGDAQFDLAQGKDPGAAKRAAKQAEQAEADAADDTLKAVCENWLKRDGAKLRTGERKRNDLARLVYPTLGNRPVAEIKRSEIVKLLDRIEDNNGETMSDAMLALLARVFTWHSGRSDDFRSPIIKGMRRTKPSERVRERILTDDELRAIWKAAGATSDPFGAMVQLLLLTGARRNEINFMRRSEIDGAGSWTLPAARNKTKVDLKRPLSTAAQKVIASLPKIDGEFLFSTDGASAIGHLSQRKARLDKASGAKGWTIHDLRRTARSLMSRAGVPVDHAERCLGHVIPGVRGVYDQHKYQSEMRLGFEKLATLIQSIVDPQDNVVPIVKAQASGGTDGQ